MPVGHYAPFKSISSFIAHRPFIQGIKRIQNLAQLATA